MINQKDHWHLNKGFTLVELMIVLAIAAIMAAVAVPSFSTYLINKQAGSLKSRLAMDIRNARIKADTQDEDMSVVPINGDWDNGWEIQNSTNAVIKQTSLNNIKDGTFTADQPRIQFNEYGRASNPVIISIKLDDCTGNHVYKITTTALGQVIVGNSACS